VTVSAQPLQGRYWGPLLALLGRYWRYCAVIAVTLPLFGPLLREVIGPLFVRFWAVICVIGAVIGVLLVLFACYWCFSAVIGRYQAVIGPLWGRYWHYWAVIGVIGSLLALLCHYWHYWASVSPSVCYHPRTKSGKYRHDRVQCYTGLIFKTVIFVKLLCFKVMA
jgi:hypothetical protein